jgi:hypothetical protein
MRRPATLLAAATVAAALVRCPIAPAQAVPALVGPAPVGLGTEPWRLERVELADGVLLEGLIDEAGPDAVFVDVVKRPPGRPMYVVTWGPITRDRIRRLEPLPAAEHDRLAARIDTFFAARETATGGKTPAESLPGLRRDGDAGPWRHESAAFTFESTADAASSRDAMARLEEVFGAFELLVPPTVRAGETAPPTVRICGTAAEYAAVQRQLGVRLENPAFYAAGRRLLVASSDLPAVTARQREAAEANAVAARRLEELDRDFAARLESLVAELERGRAAAAHREQIVQQVRGRWRKERDAEAGRIEAANRANQARVAVARREFYGRLAHEAWHAYADTRLRARGDGRLPRWLDEGLAQVLEAAPIDAGELRLGAPDPRRLAAVHQALRDGSLPPLADVLRAGPEQFLAGHATAAADAERMYLVSWALALDLAILAPVLSPAAVAGLCDEAPAADAVRRFETLVGTSLAAFEPAWRRRLLDLRPRDRAGRPVTQAR